MKAKVLGHFSETDEWEPIDGVQDDGTRYEAAGVDVTIHIYPGVAHWFMEEDRPEYNPESAQLAWQRTFEFLKQNLH